MGGEELPGPDLKLLKMDLAALAGCWPGLTRGPLLLGDIFCPLDLGLGCEVKVVEVMGLEVVVALVAGRIGGALEI